MKFFLAIIIFSIIQVHTELVKVKIKSFCLPEEFVHEYYLGNENKTELVVNKWQRAKFGTSTGLKQMCLLPNGLPLSRRCLFNTRAHAAEWEDISDPKFRRVKCMRNVREKIISRQLNAINEEILAGKRLGSGFEGRREITENLYNIFKAPKFKLLPADVITTEQILRKVSEEGKDYELCKDMLTVCNTVMSGDETVLRKSAELNATNALLETLETFMDGLTEPAVSDERCSYNLNSNVKPKKVVHSDTVDIVEESRNGFEAHISSNISIFFINPRCTNITGLALYDISEENKNNSRLFSSKYSDFLYRYIYMNETIRDLMDEHEQGFQLATFVPESLWLHIEETFEGDKRPVIVLKVFTNDSLFVEPTRERSRKPFSKVLSISIPGYNATFPEPLPILLRNRHKSTDSIEVTTKGAGCSFWNYRTWVTDNIETVTKAVDLLNEPIILCETKHLTQFSYLLGGNFILDDISDNVLVTAFYVQALDLISLVGCSLSLLGLFGIWLTAAMFKSWRSLSSTKVLLNMCIVLTLQMILFVFINTDAMAEYLVRDEEYLKCTILGALLQYSILVLFTWMLIVAMLQFQRYVTVLGYQRPHHYILKSAIVAWGLPLIPTLLVACIDPRSYIPNSDQLRTDTGICYPTGNGLLYGVVLPVTLIIIANFFIFFNVFYSVMQSLKRQERSSIIKEIQLSILLFFLLGLTWVFGLLTFMKAGIVFSYLFCLTATMQGFVLFVHFVILDIKVRNEWLYLLRPSLRKKSAQKRAEMQSLATASTVITTGEPRQ